MILIKVPFVSATQVCRRISTVHGLYHDAIRSSWKRGLYHKAATTLGIYEPLDHTQNQIRVLKIKPGR